MRPSPSAGPAIPSPRVADEIRTALHGTTIAPGRHLRQDGPRRERGQCRRLGRHRAPSNASIQSTKTGFVATASRDGRTLSVDALTRQVMVALGSTGASDQATIDVSADLTAIAPAISASQASAAAAGANAEIAPITLTHDTDKWTIPAATVASWLSVGDDARRDVRRDRRCGQGQRLVDGPGQDDQPQGRRRLVPVQQAQQGCRRGGRQGRPHARCRRAR